jgi:signal peptidase I
MGKSWRLPAVMINILLAAGLAAIWIAFAPLKLGGQVSYVLVNGISMEPHYHTGDLVLVRSAAVYQVGDVVTYHNSAMNANVIHRIIRINGDRFVFKGDNNSYLDVYRATRAEILGKLWIYLPKFGGAVSWLQLPANMALAVGLLGGFLTMDVYTKKTNKNGKRTNKTAGSPVGLFQMGLYLFGLLALVLLALFIFAFTHPLLRTADKIKYQQTGTFFYSASGTSGVYDTGAARSGDPVFTKLTCKLNLGFVYFLAGSQVQDISGSQKFDAVVLDQQSGWTRTLPLTEDTKFSGNTFTRTTTFDLCQVQTMLAAVQKETGMRPGNYTLAITAHISTAGKLSGQAYSDTFTPNLTFNFDSLHFSVMKELSKTDPLKTVQDGTLTSTAMVPNTLSLFGASLPVGKTRSISVIGLAISLAGLLGLGLYFNIVSKRSPQLAFGIKYGPLLFEVQDQGLETFALVINMATIEDLAKLAERQNAAIMHVEREFEHYYFVQIEGTTYRYVAAKHPSLNPDSGATGIGLAAAEVEGNLPTLQTR